jgi:hypothetical protein
METTSNIPTADYLNDHLRTGGYVQVTTRMRSTLYGPAHAGWFTQTARGELQVRNGKRTNTLSIPGVGLLVGIRLGRKA